MASRTYLDNAATTPVDPRVFDCMRPHMEAEFGNPSSLHWAGREANESLRRARCRVAGLLHAEPEEIVFTASGTEADNLALAGVLGARRQRENHVVVSSIEHPAILQTCRYLESLGAAVTYLPVGGDGIVDPSDLARAVRPSTCLVSVMAANNVTGAIQPITELGRIAHEHGALFHTDAVQACGKIPIDVHALEIDLLSLSAHKMHGPKGVGALYVRKGTGLSPLIHGGGQERGLRSATENTAGIAGLGCAAEIARDEMADEAARLVHLRDYIIESVETQLPNAYLIGHRYLRLPGHICIGFEGLEGEAIKLLLALDQAGLAVSSGSACSATHASEPSHVLQAMGFDPVRARGSLRVTLGRFNTKADADRFLEVLPDALCRLRAITTMPAWHA
jgi:cysteine desulfurase